MGKLGTQWLSTAIFILSILKVKAFFHGHGSWLPRSNHQVGRFKAVSSPSFGNTEVDPVAEAEWLGKAVQTHLDEEWIAQECHAELGNVCKDVYMQLHEEGKTQIMDVVVAVGEALEKVDMGDAYVGAWDVANLCSDFLMQRLDDHEPIGCSAVSSVPFPGEEEGISSSEEEDDAVEPTALKWMFTKEAVEETTEAMSTNWRRYLFQQNFLEPSEDEAMTWPHMSTIVAMLLNYKPPTTPGGPVGTEDVEERWREGYPEPPNVFLEKDNTAFLEMLELDYPENPDDLDFLDEFIDQLYGMEAHKLACKSGDVEFSQRRTIVKWLQDRNFLASFPPDPAKNGRDK
uniref:Uncharacterized protein n=1 Tax=Fibrocapsa japonica TaxID=94617 RepID=A0A7S2UZ53_9STRA|mmetsp:Transcript_21386/g.31002  ORF Transcript_21386/g.31002 Transcript_21386/m.31002 type:complete len:344 (+) Transcript_21386:43-1074(+)